MLVGFIAIIPFGLIGLMVLLGIGALLVKVIKERLQSREDDYYANNVDK